MSSPIAIPTDLGTYLGVTDLDLERAAQSIELAQDRCELYVSPLPAAAKGIVLAVAARQYNNVTSAHQKSIGTAAITYGAMGTAVGIGGLYVSKSERHDLRLMAGRSGAFSVSLLPKGTNAVQSVTVTATAGTYTLALGSGMSVPIPWNATANTVQGALEGVPGIGVGNVSVSQVGTVYTLAFQGLLAKTPLPTLTPGTTGLTGTVVVAEIITGVFAPGQNLPWWDRQ